MENTPIEWANHSFSAWVGCVKISPGCANCYACTQSVRFAGRVWGPGAPRHVHGPKYWAAPRRWNRRAERTGIKELVFANDFSDTFEEHPQVVEPRKRLFDLIDETPHLVWQILTKRPENIRKFYPRRWLRNPPHNVWLGVSVESKAYLDRVRLLLKIRAVVHFLSIEPLLEDLGRIKHVATKDIEWVIVGGESGRSKKKIRLMDADWVRGLRDQYVDAGIPFFFKQWGMFDNNPDKNDPTAKDNGGKTKGGRMLDGRLWSEMPDADS